MNISKNAIPLINSGTACYPVNSSIVAFAQKNKGKILVIGSWKIIEDKYIDQEDNLQFFEFLLRILLNNEDQKAFLSLIKPVKSNNYNS